MRSKTAVIVGDKTKQSCKVELVEDDDGNFTWGVLSGTLILGGSSGVWSAGPADKGRMPVALWKGTAMAPSDMLAVLEGVPARFLGAFLCGSAFAGEGGLTFGGLTEKERMKWEMTDPCV